MELWRKVLSLKLLAEMISIRPATASDASLLAELIRELAIYEKLEHVCGITPQILEKQLFGDRPAAEAIIGEIDGVAHGFALFFPNFSTFLGKPGLYLEDLFVRPESRGQGLGKALLTKLIEIARQRSYGRVEWSVLNWNVDAQAFYRKLGAAPMHEWTVWRVSL
jgi:GNAT superfamily N-acetyltransferase